MTYVRMDKKILIIILSGEKDRGKAITGLNLAIHLSSSTKVIFFGDSEKLAASGDAEITGLIKQLENKGSVPVACINYAEKNGIGSELKEMKFELKAISSVIQDYLAQDYVPITF